MKKPITPEKLEAKRLSKLRAAVRGVWQYDHARRALVVGVTQKSDTLGKFFTCPACRKDWPIQLATVDHEPELGSFTMDTIGDWIQRLFNGPQQVLCKPCHQRK